MFQHTAARRRLPTGGFTGVHYFKKGFNTQPRGGGCPHLEHGERMGLHCFNTQPRGGGCLFFDVIP